MHVSSRIMVTCRQLEAQPAEQHGKLWGVPFAIKDNIDAADFPTTAACPAFEYLPSHSAPAVQAVLNEGEHRGSFCTDILLCLSGICLCVLTAWRRTLVSRKVPDHEQLMIIRQL